MLLGASLLWWSGDGAHWESAAPPGAATVLLGGDELLIAGPAGVWEGPPDDLAQTLIAQVVKGGPGPVLADLNRRLWWKRDGAWTSGDMPPEVVPTAILADGQVLYLGDDTGAVWRLEAGSWTECGLVPGYFGSGISFPDIVNLAVDDGRILAATGWRAPFVSSDECASWEEFAVPADVQYSGDGSADGPDEAFPALFSAAGRWGVGGWAGFYASADAGETWSDATTVPADYTRGLVFADDFSSSGRVWIGTYATGVGWSDDGGASLTVDATGIEDPNVQRLSVSGDPNLLFAIIGHLAWVSRDAGHSWAELPTGMDSVDDITASHDGAELWAFQATSQGRDLVASADGGATFTTMTSLKSSLAGALAARAVAFTRADGAEVGCVSTVGPGGLRCTLDAGVTWTGVSLSGDASRAARPFAWPTAAPTRVVWTDSLGVHVSEDLGVTTTTTTPSGADAPLDLVEGDDGTLLFVTWGGELWRSLDGGDTWTDLALAVTSWTHVLAARPDFAAHPDILIGTHDGNFHVADASGASPTLTRWEQWERVDAGSGYVVFTGPSSNLAYSSAGMGNLEQLETGTWGSVQLRGQYIRVRGLTSGEGGGELWVDGALVGTLASDTEGVLADVPAGDSAWHDVRVVATGTGGFLLDAIEAYTPGDVLSLDPPVDTGVDSGGDTAGDSGGTGDSGGDSTSETGEDGRDDLRPTARLRTRTRPGRAATRPPGAAVPRVAQAAPDGGGSAWRCSAHGPFGGDPPGPGSGSVHSWWKPARCRHRERRGPRIVPAPRPRLRSWRTAPTCPRAGRGMPGCSRSGSQRGCDPASWVSRG